MSPTPARRFGEVAGTAYAALGIVGLSLTGLSGFASPTGVSLLGLRVNPLHNLTHVILGIALLVAASRSEDAATVAVLVTAAAAWATGLLGVALDGSTTPLALNTTDNVVHLVTATAATATWLVDRRTTAGGV